MSDNKETTLRKYNIGTEKHPYPMTRSIQNSSGRFQTDLGVLQSNEAPLEIYSEKSFSEVVGRMYRDMPTPSMLEVFKQGQIQRQPEHKRKVEFFMGDAGAGKSFLATLNAKMRCEKGAILVDCGGRDLNELIYETVLDYEGGKTVYEALDKKLAEGKLNPASLSSLRGALGNAMKEENGKFSIDWEEVGIPRADEAVLEAKASAHKQRIGLNDEDLKTLDAWNTSDDKSKNAPSQELQDKYAQYTQAIEADSTALYEQAEAQRENALKVIRGVAAAEGLNNQGGASIGLKTREGPLIRAWKENRPIILDEYNKAKPGTDDALQILWQVFIGEMDKHKVAKGAESFNFDRAEMPSQFFVTLTGNKTLDGYSTRSLSASAYQRLKPQYIEPPTTEDLQHRICQKLTGMPVSTIYKAQEEYWSEHKEQFTDFLVDMRKRGLSDEEQANIPSWQFEMLKNWDNVIQASEQLAGFYDKWAQVIDPDSQLHENAPGETGRILGEVDKKYAAEVGVGLRRMMSHMDEAELIVPEAIASKASQGVDPMTDWDQPEEIDEKDRQPTERRYGTRLSKVILKDINETAVGKDLLLTWMLKQAAEAGLFDMELEEGKTTGDRLISNLLDIDPEKQKEIPENLEEIHGVLCDYLRSKFPDIPADTDDIDIISPSALEHVLTELNGKDEVKYLTSRTGSVLHVPSIDTRDENPLTTTVAVESYPLDKPSENHGSKEHIEEYNKIAEEEKDIRETDKLPSENLVDAERYLISLAIPSTRKNNVEAMFNAKTTNLVDYNSPIDKVMNNTASNGLSATTLATKTTDENGNDRDEFLHVVHDSFGNRGEGRTLVTGTTDISPRLQKALEATGVTYVNRNDKDAGAKIDAALGDILEAKTDLPNTNQMCNEQVLSWALGLRMSLEPVDKTTVRGTSVEVYDLPNGEIYKNPRKTFLTPELRAQHRENLVSLLSDDRDHLSKSAGQRFPVYLTDSPDLDHLKNTVRSLTNEGQQSAAMGK